MRRGVGIGEPTEKAHAPCQAQTTGNAREHGDGRMEGESPKENIHPLPLGQKKTPPSFRLTGF